MQSSYVTALYKNNIQHLRILGSVVKSKKGFVEQFKSMVLKMCWYCTGTSTRQPLFSIYFYMGWKSVSRLQKLA